MQRTGGFLGVRHYGDQQLRDAIVDAQFHHLGVHHNELHILGAGLVEQADDNGVHTDGFTGAGGTGDQHMGHFRDVAHNAVARNVLTYGEGGLPLGLREGRRIDDLPQGHGGHGAIGHFDAHDGYLPGHGGNSDAGSAQAQGNVVGAACQLAETHALVQLHLIPGDAGAPGDIDDMGVDVEGGQRFIQAAGILPHFLCAVCAYPRRTAQQLNGRETISLLFRGAALGDLRGHLLCGLRGVPGRHFAGLLAGLLVLHEDSRHFLYLFLHKRRHFLGDGIGLRFLSGFRFPLGRLLLRGSLLYRDTLFHALSSRIDRGIDIQIDGIHHVRTPGRRSRIGDSFRGGLRRGMHLLLRLLGLRQLLRNDLVNGHLDRGGLLFPLLLDALIGDVVHHCRGRLHIIVLFFLPILLPGAVRNGLDNAGNGDLHGAQKRQHRGNAQNQIGNHAAAGPADQHGQTTAENAPGGAEGAAGVEIRNDFNAFRHTLLLHDQVVNTAAQENESNHADAAHGRLPLPAKNLDNEQK